MPYTISTSAGSVTLKYMWDLFRKGIDLQRGPYVDMAYLASAWSVTDAVCNALMGIGRASAALPCPVSSNLSCVHAWVEGIGEYDAKDGNPPQFNLPIVRASYGLRTWEQQLTDDPTGAMSFPNETNPGQPYTYAIQRVDYGSEAIILPDTVYKYSSDNSKVRLPMNRRVGIATLVFTRKFLTSLPTTLILSLTNNLNANTMFGAGTGQIRFDGARTTKEFVSDGTRVQEVELNFKWREFDWNAFPRGDLARFDIVKDSSGNTPYTYSDLHQLLA